MLICAEEKTIDWEATLNTFPAIKTQGRLKYMLGMGGNTKHLLEIRDILVRIRTSD
jgi:hypothetical protein